MIYHMCRKDEWAAANSAGSYKGSSQDLEDGFIHFSSKDQIMASAAKHRAGQDGLMLIFVNSGALGDKLKWEEGRDGQLFPHLYGVLSLDAVAKAEPLLLGPDGTHIFPEL